MTGRRFEDSVIVFDMIAGRVSVETREGMARSAIAHRVALEEAWELTGCFRTEDAEVVAVRVHEIARKALGK